MKYVSLRNDYRVSMIDFASHKKKKNIKTLRSLLVIAIVVDNFMSVKTSLSAVKTSSDLAREFLIDECGIIEIFSVIPCCPMYAPASEL